MCSTHNCASQLPSRVGGHDVLCCHCSISVNNCGDMSHFSQQLQQASLQKSSSTYTVGKLTVGTFDCFVLIVLLGYGQSF